MTHGKYLQKLAEISLGWSDKPVPNNLLSLSIAFWFVRKLSIQFGLRDSKHVGFFIRGDNTYICINICKWECSVDLLKSPKVTVSSYWAEYSSIIALITSTMALWYEQE